MLWLDSNLGIIIFESWNAIAVKVIKYKCIEAGKAEERQKAANAAQRAAAAFAASAAAAMTNDSDMNV
ncbi:MAG: hypothetical protein ACKPKO_25975 [Candidatus Fonsibacter sp.]